MESVVRLGEPARAPVHPVQVAARRASAWHDHLEGNLSATAWTATLNDGLDDVGGRNMLPPVVYEIGARPDPAGARAEF
jgi:hypothetical protein